MNLFNDEMNQVLRIEIDNSWTSYEFQKFLENIEELYNLSFFFKLYQHDLKYHEKAKLRLRLNRKFYSINNKVYDGSLLLSEEKLNIYRLQYGSKGFTDLSGLGSIIGHLKDFILEIIKMSNDRKKVDVELQRNKEDLLSKKLDNAKKYLEIAKEYGLSTIELRSLMNDIENRQDHFINLIEQGKLENVRLLTDKEKKHK